MKSTAHEKINCCDFGPPVSVRVYKSVMILGSSDENIKSQTTKSNEKISLKLDDCY